MPNNNASFHQELVDNYKNLMEKQFPKPQSDCGNHVPTKQRKTHKITKKTNKKTNKIKSKTLIQNNNSKWKHKFSPDYTESTETQFERPYYSDEHKPYMDKTTELKNVENYLCYLNYQIFDKLKEELMKERDQELINQMAQFNI